MMSHLIEPPHLDLPCLQIQFFFVLGLLVLKTEKRDFMFDTT